MRHTLSAMPERVGCVGRTGDYIVDRLLEAGSHHLTIELRAAGEDGARAAGSATAPQFDAFCSLEQLADLMGTGSAAADADDGDGSGKHSDAGEEAEAGAIPPQTARDQ